MNDQQPPRPPHGDRPPQPTSPLSPSERQRLHTVQHRWDTVYQDVITTRIVRGIYYLGGALQLLLGLRFLLQLSGANRDNLFARFIYNFSAPFAAPFDGLFNPPTFGDGANIFDTNILVGMVGYSILVLLAIRLIWVFRVERN
jgi:YggT family protein